MAQPADSNRTETVDATRRTRLATERTELAWWRTGLTALAVALGVGRVVPELNHGLARWPYVVVGVGFAIWGIVAIAYGSARGAAVEEALSRGSFQEPPAWMLRALTWGGIVLGCLTGILILVD